MGEHRESGGPFVSPAQAAGAADASDRRVWSRVLVLALVGFGVGMAWPKLTGVRFGPNAPGESSSSAGRAPEKVEVPALIAAPSPTASEAPVAPLPTVASTVKVAESFVLGCTTKDGETKKGADCGPYRELDKVAEPKLRRLVVCPAARNATGHISLVASLDFARRRLDASLGKSTSLQNADPSAVLGCLRTELESIDIAAMPHDQAKYTLVYKIDLEDGTTPVAAAPVLASSAPIAAPMPAASAAPTTTVSSGTSAEVTWDSALVRSSPRTGDVVARLPRGTKIKLGTADNGWWHINYGDNNTSEGWVYRAAIGR